MRHIFVACLLLSLFYLGNATTTNEQYVREIVENLLQQGLNDGIITTRQSNELLALFPKTLPDPPIHIKEPTKVLGGDTIVNPIEEKLEDDTLLQKTKDLTFKTFGYVKDGLTLLNVLYFGGGTLIIASMSLFITVGFAKFDTAGLLYIGSCYIIFFHGIAHFVWYNFEEYRIIAGIFATISVGVCPFVIFSFLDVFNLSNRSRGYNYTDFHRWVSSSFLPIEIGTAIFGIITLITIPFPFITMPVSFCMWYATMDLSEFFYGRSFSWKQRAQVSTASGLVLILIAYGIEVANPSTDFSFWIYLFGLIAFWFGLSTQGEGSNSGKFIYTLIQAALIIVSHPMFLDRYMFAFWGLVGFLVVYSGMINATMNSRSNSFWFTCQFVPAILLLFSTTLFDTSTEVVSFFSTKSAAFLASVYAIGCCQFLYQTLYVHGVWFSIRVLHFTLFLGILCSLNVFQMEISIPLLEGFLHWTIPCWFVVGILAVVCCVAQFTPTAQGWMGLTSMTQRFELLFALWLIVYNGSVYLSQGVSQSFAVRLGLMVVGITAFLMHGFFYIPQYADTPNLRKLLEGFMYFSIAGAAILWYLESVLFFFIPFAGIAFLFKPFGSYSKEIRHYKLLFGLLVIAEAVILDSKLLISLGGLILFVYLSTLARIVFMDSLLFPLFLTSIGLWIIGLGFLYQWYYNFLRNLMLNTVNNVISDNAVIVAITKVLQVPSEYLDRSLFWLNDLFAIFTVNPSYAVIVVAFILFGMAVACWYRTNIWEKLHGITETSPAHVNVSYCAITKETSREGHGFAIRIKGTKPQNLTITQAWLHIDNTYAWKCLESIAPAIAIQVFRSSMYPIKMCPMMVDSSCFVDGSSSFDAKIEFGSGTNGGPSISHATLFSTLSRIDRNATFNLRVVFATSSALNSMHVINTKSGLLGLFGSPIKIGNLCSLVLRPSGILDSRRGDVIIMQ